MNAEYGNRHEVCCGENWSEADVVDALERGFIYVGDLERIAVLRNGDLRLPIKSYEPDPSMLFHYRSGI